MKLRGVKQVSRLVARYCVSSGKGFRLKDYDPADTAGFDPGAKPLARELLQRGVQYLAAEQDKLYAQNRWALLLIFQAMDAAGKDGTIKHVMSGINPQGCQVFSFKSPSAEELDHDFLWRTMRAVPERGRIGIFNRSYYEEVLVVRVHPEFLKAQHIPPQLVGKNIWQERYEDIRNYESYLGRNGVIVRKFFLNVSKQEQKKRFMRRLEDPERNWKFSASDARERGHWNDYMEAYEDAIRETATKIAPWYVVPADNKWFARVVVAASIAETLHTLNLRYPVVDAAKRKELEAAKALLEENSTKKQKRGEKLAA